MLKKLSFLDIFILVSPIFDVLVFWSISKLGFNSNLGMIFRGLFLLIFSIIVFLKSNKEDKKKLVLFFSFLGIYFLFYAFNQYFTYGITNLFENIKSLLKFFTFPMVVINAIIYFRGKNNVFKVFEYLPYIYIALLIIPIIVGGANLSYKYGSGTSGWFYSPNEVSVMLAIIAPFIIYKLLEKPKVSNLLFIILYIYTCLTIGTKTPLLGVVMSLFFVFVVALVRLFISKWRSKDTIISFFLTLLILATSVCLFFGSNLYTNIVGQYSNYNKYASNFNNKETPANNNNTTPNTNIKDVLFPEIIYLNTPKYNFSPNKVLNMIFSNRDILLRQQFIDWQDSLLYEKIMGQGIKSFKTNNRVGVELDVFDIFFHFGIVGFLIYFVLMLYVLFHIIKYGFKELINDNKRVALLSSLLIGCFVSLFAGHLLGAPAVSILFAVIFAYSYTNLKISDQFNLKYKKYLCIIPIIMIILEVICIININNTVKKYPMITLGNEVIINGYNTTVLEDKTLVNSCNECTAKYIEYDDDVYSFQLLVFEIGNNKYLFIRNFLDKNIKIGINANEYISSQISNPEYEQAKNKLLSDVKVNGNYYKNQGSSLILEKESYIYDYNALDFNLINIKAKSVYEIYMLGVEE